MWPRPNPAHTPINTPVSIQEPWWLRALVSLVFTVKKMPETLEVTGHRRSRRKGKMPAQPHPSGTSRCAESSIMYQFGCSNVNGSQPTHKVQNQSQLDINHSELISLPVYSVSVHHSSERGPNCVPAAAPLFKPNGPYQRPASIGSLPALYLHTPFPN